MKRMFIWANYVAVITFLLPLYSQEGTVVDVSSIQESSYFSKGTVCNTEGTHTIDLYIPSSLKNSTLHIMRGSVIEDVPVDASSFGDTTDQVNLWSVSYESHSADSSHQPSLISRCPIQEVMKGLQSSTCFQHIAIEVSYTADYQAWYLMPRSFKEKYLTQLIDVSSRYELVEASVYNADQFFASLADNYKESFSYIMEVLSKFEAYQLPDHSQDSLVGRFIREFSPFSPHYSVLWARYIKQNRESFNPEYISLLEALFGSLAMRAVDADAHSLLFFNGLPREDVLALLRTGGSYFFNDASFSSHLPGHYKRYEFSQNRDNKLSYALRHYYEDRMNVPPRSELQPSSFGHLRPVATAHPLMQEIGSAISDQEVAIYTVTPELFSEYDSLEALLAMLPASLEGLDMSGCPIEVLPDGLFERFTQLRVLCLSGCGLRSIAPNAFKIGYDQVDNLTDAKSHDYALSQASPLLLLDLSYNQLEELPEDVFIWCSQLRYLDLSYNSLRGAHPDFSYLHYLKNLGMSHTEYTFLQAQPFWNNPYLQVLDLSHNESLEIELSQLEGIKSLTILFLNNTRLRASIEACGHFAKNNTSLMLLSANPHTPETLQLATSITQKKRLPNFVPFPGCSLWMPYSLVHEWFPAIARVLIRRAHEQRLISTYLRNRLLSQVGDMSSKDKKLSQLRTIQERIFNELQNNSVRAGKVTVEDVTGMRTRNGTFLNRLYHYGYYLFSDAYNEKIDEKRRLSSYYVTEETQKELNYYAHRRSVMSASADIATAALVAGEVATGGGITPLISSALLSATCSGMNTFTTPLGNVDRPWEGVSWFLLARKFGIEQVQRGADEAPLRPLIEQLSNNNLFRRMFAYAITTNQEIASHLSDQAHNALRNYAGEVSDFVHSEELDILGCLIRERQNDFLTAAQQGTHSTTVKQTGLFSLAIQLFSTVLTYSLDYFSSPEGKLSCDIHQAQEVIEVLPLWGMTLELGAHVIAPLALIIDSYTDNAYVMNNGHQLARCEVAKERLSRETYTAVNEHPFTSLPLKSYQRTQLRNQFPFLHNMWSRLPRRFDSHPFMPFKECNATVAHLTTLLQKPEFASLLEMYLGRIKALSSNRFTVFSKLKNAQGLARSNAFQEGQAIKRIIEQSVLLFDSLHSLSVLPLTQGVTRVIAPLKSEIEWAFPGLPEEINDPHASSDVASDAFSAPTATRVARGKALYDCLTHLEIYLRALHTSFSHEEYAALLRHEILSRKAPYQEDTLSGVIGNYIDLIGAMREKLLALMPSLQEQSLLVIPQVPSVLFDTV